MRIQQTLVLIAAAGASLSALAAPPSVANEAAGAAMASVPVVGASYKLQPSELEGVQGEYALTDGRTLRVTSVHRKLYAQLGQASTELVPVAANVFVSRDEAMRVQFDAAPFATRVKLDVRVN